MLILFGGDQYYPDGGANDFICSHSDLSILVNLGKKLEEGDYMNYNEVDWWHVYDTSEGKIVAKSSGLPRGI